MRGEKLAPCRSVYGIMHRFGVGCLYLGQTQVEPVFSALLGYFPSKLNISYWGLYVYQCQAVATDCGQCNTGQADLADPITPLA